MYNKKDKSDRAND